MQWNFSLQYELPDDMLLDAACAGNAPSQFLLHCPCQGEDLKPP